VLARINKLRRFYKCVVLTLDAPRPGKREADERQQLGSGESVWSANQEDPAAKPPAGAGIGQQMFWGTAADLTWHTTLPWLARHTDLPVVLKGLQTHEDAFLAARYAAEHPGTVRAIILSNHGGRSLDTAPPAVHTLLEIRKYCPEVFDRVEVWVDGGIKRGTDAVKALCLGARAVGVGRPALWGLGAGGWQGVDRVFESESGPAGVPTGFPRPRPGRVVVLTPPGLPTVVFADEMQRCMQFLGAQKVADLGPRLVRWFPRRCRVHEAR